LLDSSISETNDSTLDNFLEKFYKTIADSLFENIFALEKRLLFPNLITKVADTNYFLLTELLAFISSHHAMYSKTYLVNNQLIQKTAILLIHPKPLIQLGTQFIELGAVKVIRCLLDDEFYKRILARHDILGSLFECLLKTNGKDSLLNSSLLEFFEYVRTVLNY
jgi:hypothetical protein